MKEISLKPKNIQNFSLAKNAVVNNNTATTKNIAVQPNRHSLAIFTPTHSTGVNISSLLSTDNVLTVYGGLIEPNKIPFWGNKFSPLCWIVETRQPFLWLVNLTKNIGIPTVNNTVIHHSLTVLADEYHRHTQLHAQNPHAGHADRANAIYNAMDALVSLVNAQDGQMYQPSQKPHESALQRCLAHLLKGVRYDPDCCVYRPCARIWRL